MDRFENGIRESRQKREDIGLHWPFLFFRTLYQLVQMPANQNCGLSSLRANQYSGFFS
jgi:hypothetical protein